MTTVAVRGGDPLDVADRALVARVAAGDREALAQLHALHRGALSAYLWALLRDPAAVEEALQDTLLAVWRGAARFEGRARVATWLYAIARRQAWSRLRRRRPDVIGDESLADLADTDPGPEERVVAGADADGVRAAVARLAPLEREVLVLTFWHGLSSVEIGAVLGVPDGTVRRRLFTARQHLRRTLRTGGDR